MKKIYLSILVLASFVFTQCTEAEPKNTEVKSENTEISKHSDAEAETQDKPFYQGTILETIDAGGYSYLRIEESHEGHQHVEGEKHKDFWVAVNRTPAKVGDFVRFQKELVTEKFYSKTLDRTFDELMFASNLQFKVEE